MTGMPHDFNSPLDITPHQRMLDGLFEVAVFCKPGAGVFMEYSDAFLFETMFKPAVQQVLKQVVIAKPPVLIVHGGNKQVGFFQQLYKFLTAYFAGT